MDITSLKSGLWGYKKSCVCEYIAAMGEEYSRKLTDTVRERDAAIDALHQKLAALEAENAEYNEEQRRRIDDFRFEIDEVRGSVRRLLDVIERDFSESAKTLDAVSAKLGAQKNQADGEQNHEE